jgi:hypothetical protein
MRTCRRSWCYIHRVPHFEIQAFFSVQSRYLNVQVEVKKNYNTVKCRLSGKICFLVLVPQGVCLLSSDDFYRDSSLVQDLIREEFKN